MKNFILLYAILIIGATAISVCIGGAGNEIQCGKMGV